MTTTRSLASDPHDHTLRQEAKRALRYPPVRFNGKQALCIANGFRDAMDEHDYVVHALAILPDHVHLILARHQRHVDRIAAHLKAKATRALTQADLHPIKRFEWDDRVPSPWSRNHWCPFIDTPEHLRAAIRYVEQNPSKSGLPRQCWRFVSAIGKVRTSGVDADLLIRRFR